MPFKPLLPALLSCTLFVGCATSPQVVARLYPGETRPDDQIAKVWFDEARQTQPLFGYWEWVELRAIDGQVVKADSNAKRAYQLLPGCHRLTVRYLYDASGAQGLLEALVGQAIQERMTKRFEADIDLDAKAGDEYGVKFNVAKESAWTPVTNWKINYRIVDIKTGAVVPAERVCTAEVPK